MCPKHLFCVEMLFAEHMLSEEIILNEVRFIGSPTINFALLVPYFWYIPSEKIGQFF